MGRKVRDAKLESRTARHALKASRQPQYRLIEPGLHLGYRKPVSGPGTWVVRRLGGEKYIVNNLVTSDGSKIIADDFSEADGHTVLSFGQAQERAKAQRVKIAAEATGPYTVGAAMDDYIAFLERSRRTANGARCTDRAFIRPHFGTTDVEKLTTKKIQTWLDDLAKQPRRLRTRRKEKQKFRELSNDKESIRRRQSSANRIFTVLKAALNRAWRNGRVSTDSAWRRVEPFHSVDGSRTRYLSVIEAQRLINACPADFRKLVQAALATGARYGQLAELVASDFNADKNTVRMRSRKGSGKEKVYHVVLAPEGAQFFKKACAGLASTDTIFKKASGEPWGSSAQNRPMEEACRNAKIVPPIGIHGLRHTWASLSVMAGMPLMVVAENLGHSDTRMCERHYGHLAPSFVAASIREHAPTFGFERESVVVPIR